MRSLSRPFLLTLAALAGAGNEPAPAQTTPDVADRPLAAYARSRMRALTCTPDGRWMFLAEGGALVLVHTWDENTDRHVNWNFALPGGSKKFQVGSRGILASALALDPECATVPEGGPADLLYLAGGRDGLWVVEADTRPLTHNRAWRVDDSQDLDPATQDGRRWCADLRVARVGDTTYLLALFGAKGDSRLRLYELDDVRAIAAAGGAETGAELAPAVDVPLGANPFAPANFAHESFGRSLGLALCADAHVDGAGAAVADVYVALAHHGLARVALRPGPNGPSAAVTFGPVLGTGSSYEQDAGHLLVPDHLSPALYGNLVHEDRREFIDVPRIDREELPVVSDVAVLRATVDGEPTVHLYAAVDHLFWLALDLSAAPFGPTSPLLHHEGEELAFVPAGGTVELHGMRAPASGDKLAFAAARNLAVVEHPEAGPLLVVTTWTPFAKDYLAYLSEGVAYDADFAWGGGAAIVPGSPPATFVYRVRHDPVDGFSFDELARITSGGGPGLAVPDGPGGQDLPGRLRLFHNHLQAASGPPGFEGEPSEDLLKTAGTALDVVRLDGSSGLERFARAVGHVRGTLNFQAAFDRLRTDLLVTAKNDGGLAGAGLLQIVDRGAETRLQARFAPEPGGVVDRRVDLELLFDPDSQLVEGHAADTRSYLSAGHVAGKSAGPTGRWQWTRLFVPPGPRGVRDAVQEARWTMKPPNDAFDNPGRWFYMGLTAEPAFDAHLAATGVDDRLMFGTRQRSPEGLVVIDRDAMLAWAQANGEEDADHDLAQLEALGVHSEGLVTHPEFNWMPRADAMLRDWWRDAPALPATLRSDARNSVVTWSPQVFSVRDPADPDLRRWVMAVPCGTIQGDPEWNVFDVDPGWAPRGIFADWYGHGLVQFFELADDPGDDPDRGVRPVTWTHPGYDLVAGTADDVERCSPIAKLIPPIGPRSGAPKGNVWRLRHFEATVAGTTRVYLFCADFAGRLFVYSVEDVLTQTDPAARLDDASFLVASWETPEALADDLPSALFDVAVDPGTGGAALVYAAVRRVGVVVLRFDPQAPPGQRLVEVERLSTAEFASSVDVRALPDGSRQLLVSDYGGGVRLFESR